jgi:glycine/D-amino acid oxidase-like deaminating enzyme/nitrite reductase/ring-hydroxylating ferredoxin subunit
VITRLKIECALTDAPAYTCAATDGGVRSIEEEAEAARAAGLPVELTTSTDLPFAVASAVRLDGQAHFDPVAFCDGLAAHLRREGVPIIERTRVNAVEEERDACTVRVGETTVSCDYAVITTHLPITDPALLAGRTHPERSYAVSGPVPSGASAQIEGMYLATDTGWSIRPARVGTERWLVVGGEGHSMQDHVTSSDHYRRLEWWARDRLAVDVRHCWSAFDYAPTDGVPFIGRLAPRTSRRFVATGFRKWGMSTSMVAAQLIGDLLAGTEHPAHSLFDASRILPTLGRDAVKANMKVAAHFIGDRLQVRRAPSLDDLGPGEGRVMRVGGQAVAAARATDGTLHTVKATCTHLGCLVAFNDGDQTWDCPCHGSRFALDGSVIDGPASSPLDAVDATAQASNDAG